jgi:hypothetical protein
MDSFLTRACSSEPDKTCYLDEENKGGKDKIQNVDGEEKCGDKIHYKTCTLDEENKGAARTKFRTLMGKKSVATTSPHVETPYVTPSSSPRRLVSNPPSRPSWPKPSEGILFPQTRPMNCKRVLVMLSRENSPVPFLVADN